MPPGGSLLAGISCEIIGQISPRPFVSAPGHYQAVKDRAQAPSLGWRNAIEEHLLDADVIVKVFGVAERAARYSRPGGAGQARNAKRAADDAPRTRSPPGKIRCSRRSASHRLAEHRPRRALKHAFEIGDIVTVFARGDIHAWRTVIAHQVEAGKIIGGNRFFEPADIELGKDVTQLERLLARVGAIRIDKEFALRRQSLRGRRRRVRDQLFARGRFSFSPAECPSRPSRQVAPAISRLCRK